MGMRALMPSQDIQDRTGGKGVRPAVLLGEPAEQRRADDGAEVADRTKRIEFLPFLLRVEAAHFLRPQSVLSEVAIEEPTRLAGLSRRARQDLAADGTGRLVLLQQPGLAVERRGCCVPGTV